MWHPAEETLLAHTDGELAALEQAKVSHHLTRCAACRLRSEQVRTTTTALVAVLGALDGAEPDSWHAGAPAGSGARHGALPGYAHPAVGGEPARAAVSHAHPQPAASRRRTGRDSRWAAGIALALGAAGAAAMFGLPLLENARREAPAIEMPRGVAAPSAAGGAIAVQPVDGVFELALENVAAAGTRVTVEFSEADDVAIEIAHSEHTRFRAARGVVTADLSGTPASVHLRAPASLRAGVLRVDGIVIATFSAGTLIRVVDVAGRVVSIAEVH